MKRVINYGSLAAIVGLAWLILTSSSAAPVAIAAERFEGLPLGRPMLVRFSGQNLGSLDGTTLERQNQLRDWLLYTAVSDAQLDDDAVSRVFFDMPPLRSGYVEAIARFEYGATRSRTISKGEVVALVPKTSAAERLDDLATIADAEYKTTGDRATLHVFEYELAPEGDRGWLTRLADLSAASLFSPEYGYVETPISSAEDLQRFLLRAQSVTSARWVNGTLVLGGRGFRGKPHRGLRLEDVAALWQAEVGSRAFQKAVEEFDQRWSGLKFPASEIAQRQKEHDQEFAELRRKFEGESGSGHLTDSSGFSLDPVFDFDALDRIVSQLEAPLRDAIAQGLAKPPHQFDAIRRAVDDHDAGPLLETVYALQHEGTPKVRLIAKLVEMAVRQAQFQQARYEGKLQGTEVGMVLFYTDLMAKLWAMDFDSSAPTDRVPDFVPMLTASRSPIFEAELNELSGTRLWFGPLDDGYQKTADGVLMAHTATRVYAASSNTLRPGQEAEPNASSARFLWWWNNHYDAVAAAEPEYQRLNEIMKWGLILSRQDHSEFHALSFLRDVTVTRTHWFPTWAASNPRLVFSAWEHIPFLPRGAKGTTAEALPTLKSRGYAGRQISGGVSLPSRRVLIERPQRPESLDVLLRRSIVKEEAMVAEGRMLKAFDDTAFVFKTTSSPLDRLVTVTPRPAARLRSADFELRNHPFDLHFSRQADGLTLRVAHGSSSVGEFSVRRGPGGFDAVFRGNELERARTMLRVADDAATRGEGDLAATFAKLGGVDRVVPVGDGSVFVRLDSATPKWLRVADEGAPSVGIGDGVDLRYASLGHGDREGRRWTAAWVDEAVATAKLNEAPFYRVRSSGGTLDGVIAEPVARGPPAGAQPAQIATAGGPVSGWRDAEGWTYFAKQSPDAMWETAASVRDPKAVASAAGRDVGRFLMSGDYRRTAQALAANPHDAPSTMRALRDAALRRADADLSAGRPSHALADLSALSRILPDDPHVALRQAMALIDSGHDGAGLNALADVLHGGEPEQLARVQLAAEAYVRQAPQSAADAATMLRAAHLRPALSRSAAVKGDVHVVLDRTGRMKMEVRLLDWQAHAATAAEARGNRIYVEVAGDVDPVIGFRPSMEQVLSEGAVVERLQSWEVAAAGPDVIVDRRTGIRYARVVGTVATAGVSLGLSWPSCRDDDTRDECRAPVYLVRRPGPST